MPIVRVSKHQHNFLIMDKTGLNDERLSYRAKGLLATLLAKPDAWEVHVEHLATQSPNEGREAIRSALRELENAGYARRQKKPQTALGKLAGWETVVYETPQSADYGFADYGSAVVGADYGLTDYGKPVVGLLDLKEVSIDSSKYPKKEEEVSIEGKARARASRQLPNDWTISEAIVEWAQTHFPLVAISFEKEKFCDHYRANGKAMKDWDAAFRNWLRKAVEFQGNHLPTSPQPSKPRLVQ